MKRAAFIAGILALSLTGCVLLGPDETVKIGDRTFTIKGGGFNADLKALPSPELVFVFVTPSGKIVVDQEPVRPTRSDGPIMILWVLAAKTSINFPDKNAIQLVVDPLRKNPLPSGLACDVLGSAKKYFACIYDKPSEPRQWKYSIRVRDGSTSTDFDYLDPWIHQP